jgi:hypothetical protein
MGNGSFIRIKRTLFILLLASPWTAAAKDNVCHAAIKEELASLKKSFPDVVVLGENYNDTAGIYTVTMLSQFTKRTLVVLQASSSNGQCSLQRSLISIVENPTKEDCRLQGSYGDFEERKQGEYHYYERKKKAENFSHFFVVAPASETTCYVYQHQFGKPKGQEKK